MSPFHASVDTPPTVLLKEAGQPGKLQGNGEDRERKKKEEGKWKEKETNSTKLHSS
jgi:hypothetical protein